MKGQAHKPYIWCKISGRVRLKAKFYGTLCIKLESLKIQLPFEWIRQKNKSILNLVDWCKLIYIILYSKKLHRTDVIKSQNWVVLKFDKTWSDFIKGIEENFKWIKNEKKNE